MNALQRKTCKMACVCLYTLGSQREREAWQDGAPSEFIKNPYNIIFNKQFSDNYHRSPLNQIGPR